MTASTEPSPPSPIDPNEECFTPVELAALLKVGKKTILGWLNSPEHPLNGYRLGNNTWRIPKSAVKTYLEGKYGNGR